VLLVTPRGKVIKKAFGLPNVELEVPMKEQIVFNIGSITRQFTAVAILQSVAESIPASNLGL